MFDLPAHLSTLNTIASLPSVVISRENDEAFWDFMLTDQLLDNFSAVSPEPPKAESQPIQASAPEQSQPELPIEQAQRRPQLPAATLDSFIAAFANEPTTNYRLSIPLPLSYNSGASSSSLTPAPAIDTASVLPRLDVAMDAGPLEMEEDKRRRNTEASARFRAKKKEREQALQKREKELEAQVAQQIAEKASLENENKLLKEIVLGGQAGASADETMQGALTQLGAKRKRE